MFTQNENRGFIGFSAEIIKCFFKNRLISDILLNFNSCNVVQITGKGSEEQLLVSLLEDVVYSVNRESLSEKIVSYLNFMRKNKISSGSDITIFDVVYFFVRNVIYRLGNQYRYRYEFTDIWNNMTVEVSEELMVSTAAVQDSMRCGSKNIPSDWNYCINCDNIEIHEMLGRDAGVSENHFHLRGSTPYFDVAWIHIMNHPNDDFLCRMAEKIEVNRLKNGVNKREPIRILIKKAAAIRIYLYNVLYADNYIFDEGLIYSEDLKDDCREFDIPYQFDEDLKLLKIKHLRKLYYKYDFPFLRLKSRSCESLYRWLVNHVFPCDRSDDFDVWDTLQSIIDHYAAIAPEKIDYAQSESNCGQKYYNIQGERFLLNECLRRIYSETEHFLEIRSLLYIYLSIKYQLYDEIVQNNSRRGFFNFAEFQDRKDFFLPWSYEMEKKLTLDTICSVIDDVKIHSVELRISPSADSKENVELLRVYDSAIEEAIEKCKSDGMNRSLEVSDFYYVYHFVKSDDKENPDDVCRNYQARKQALRKAYGIINMKEHSLDMAKRVKGIDACSYEINCRPETFGCVFRLLQYYSNEPRNITAEKLPQLRATYHVGEDNYDILDSLRAIHETILFLSLSPGSRLGHATYLGMNTNDYYTVRNENISLPKQVWLDNVVWLYYFLQENNIEYDGKIDCLHFLKNEFNKYFTYIYEQYINEYRIEGLMKFIPHDTYTKLPCGYSECHFDMNSYYYSWLLRGDDPYLFSMGYYQKDLLTDHGYRICTSDNRMNAARDDLEACYLYYLYHFKKYVKDKGMEPVTVDVPKNYVTAIDKVQQRLTEMIAARGIAIECNPTSNLKISTMRGYTDHPVLNFYRSGLTGDRSDVHINVSINTDDKSVFTTSLKNEYTYLLYYLEQEKNEDGSQKYSRYEIMKWLDDIRRMGNEQSFIFDY